MLFSTPGYGKLDIQDTQIHNNNFLLVEDMKFVSSFCGFGLCQGNSFGVAQGKNGKEATEETEGKSGSVHRGR